MSRKETRIRTGPFSSRTARILALFTCLCTESAFGGSAVGVPEVDSWFGHMARTNRSSPVEGAGSHGAWGVSVGAGITSLEAAEDSVLMREQLTHAAPVEGGETQVLPKAWVVKGTSWPLDLGAMGGVAPGGRLTQAGIHAQWTVYEGFRLPALAVRMTGSRLNGFKSSEIRSLSLSGQASYGWSYVSAFAGIGFTRHDASVSIGSTDPAGYLLTSAEDGAAHSETFSDQWIETSYNLGAKAVVWPPFVSLGAEWLGGDGPNTFAAKVAIGL